jgi:hypothetical protein
VTRGEELAKLEERRVVVPGTGELVEIDDPRQVAKAVGSIRELERRLYELRRGLIQLLVEESQRVGSKTLRFPDVEVEITGGVRLQWDIDKLKQLRDVGLPEERLNALVYEVVEEKVDGRIAAQLRGANPTYARIIDEAKHYVPATWGATVKQA